MGLSPDIWGPSTWTFLHLIVLAEPDDPILFDKRRLVYYKQLYTLLQELLPCDKCRIHLKENLQKLKNIEDLQSKRELFDWTTNLHNLVNGITKKHTYALQDSYDLWNSIAIGNHLPTNYWKYTTIILIVLIIVLLIALGFQHRKK